MHNIFFNTKRTRHEDNVLDHKNKLKKPSIFNVKDTNNHTSFDYFFY